MPIKNIDYTDSPQVEIDTLETMHPDIIFLKCSYPVSKMLFFQIHESKALKNTALALVNSNEEFSQLIYEYDEDVAYFSDSFSNEEMIVKCTDMLIYKDTSLDCSSA